MYLLCSEGSPHKDVPSVTNAMTISVGQDDEPVEQGTDKIQWLSTTEENFTVSNTSEDLDLNSPHKNVPSVTNAMAIGVGQDGEPVEQGTDKIQRLSTTEENFTVSDTSEDLDLNSQPLHLPDTYDRLDAIKPTNPTDVYDELEPRQLLHPANDDKPPPSNTCDQLPSANTTYGRLRQLSKTIPRNRLSTPNTPRPFLSSSITLIGEVSDSDSTNTDDDVYYFGQFVAELPCNIKKDAHTRENAYQGQDVRCLHKTCK